MNFIGVLLNMIAIMVLGDYGLFADGVNIHEDSSIYDVAWNVRETVALLRGA